jgi:hypothetical protein
MSPVPPRIVLRFAFGLVAIAATGSALALGSTASAQVPTTVTFKELSKGSTFDFVDQAPMSAPRRRRPDLDARTDSRARRHLRHRLGAALRHDRPCAITAYHRLSS